MLKKGEVIWPNIYSNHDVIRGAGVFDEVTGDRLPLPYHWCQLTLNKMLQAVIADRKQLVQQVLDGNIAGSYEDIKIYGLLSVVLVATDVKGHHPVISTFPVLRTVRLCSDAPPYTYPHWRSL